MCPVKSHICFLCCFPKASIQFSSVVPEGLQGRGWNVLFEDTQSTRDRAPDSLSILCSSHHMARTRGGIA